jgi:hypothetical protein
MGVRMAARQNSMRGLAMQKYCGRAVPLLDTSFLTGLAAVADLCPVGKGMFLMASWPGVPRFCSRGGRDGTSGEQQTRARIAEAAGPRMRALDSHMLHESPLQAPAQQLEQLQSKVKGVQWRAKM